MGCGLDSPTMTVSCWGGQEPGCSVHRLTVSAPKAWRLPGEVHGFGLYWNPKEVSSDTGGVQIHGIHNLACES